MPPKKKAAEETPHNVNEDLDKELAEMKLTNLVKLAENLTDMTVVTVSTGLPQLDHILHKDRPGFPLGRDVEIFSKDPEAGKTSLALRLLKEAQQHGLRTCIVDIEKTVTQEYLDVNGIITDPFEDPTKYAVRMVRHEDDAIPAETILETIRVLSQKFDLIVVDSVAALEEKAEQEKDMSDPSKMGGISKLLSSFTRKNVAKRACIIWINQTRQKVGGYNPTGNIQYVTTGGRALPFFCSIRLALSLKEKITSGDEVIGMKILVKTEKNKVSPPYKQCILTYLFSDESFSTYYDYYELGLKVGFISKNKGWFSVQLPAVVKKAKDLFRAQYAPIRCDKCAHAFPVEAGAAASYSCPECGNEKENRVMDPDELYTVHEQEEFKVNGENNFVKAMKENQRLYEAVKAIVDGEPADAAAA